YQDFGAIEQIARALEEGFVFQGEHFRFWNAPRGSKPAGIPLYRHVICTQNHDQVGNRAQGDRLTHLIPLGARKLTAALLLLAPHTPMLWMGQEYDEAAPFQFFTDFGDPALRKAVSEGRRREFEQFSWTEVPDPQDPETFQRSKLRWTTSERSHRDMLEWYRSLLRLRREFIMESERTCRAEIHSKNKILTMQVPAQNSRLLLLAELPAGASAAEQPLPDDGWQQTLSSSEDGFRVQVYRR
ncbi:MAG: hypothetical protein AB7O65_04395, partial [Candidatus Korobacteraceae bacterium]